MTNRPVICSCGAQYPTMAHVEQCEATDHRQAATATASPRVAEELVEKCAIAIWQRHGMADEWDDVSEVGRASWRRTAAAIITLAQDAQARDLLNWISSERNIGRIPSLTDVVDALRAQVRP